MMRRKVDPNGTDSVGNLNPSSNSNVPQFSTTSDLNLNLSPTITAVSSDTTDLLHRTSLSSGVTHHNFNPVPRQQPFSPTLYRLIPSQNSSSSHNNNNHNHHNHHIPSSFPGTQDSSNFSVPSILSISTNASSFQPSGPRMNYPAPTMQLSSNNIMSSSSSSRSNDNISPPLIPNQSLPSYLRSRSRSRDEASFSSPPVSPVMKRGRAIQQQQLHNHTIDDTIDKEEEMLDEKETRRKEICSELAKNARKENDAMVYLDGPRIYTCGECRTHLTSHDEIISKSFHGRHGRAYLFDQCVNITIGPAEDRRLITGLHSVCDILCKRCKTLIGWTYAKAYEQSQKYKEGKYIIEKIHLHMEESDCYKINLPAGEKRDRWRIRSMSWSSENSLAASPRTHGSNTVYEYKPRCGSSLASPRFRSRSISTGGVSSIGSPQMLPAAARPPSPSHL